LNVRLNDARSVKPQRRAIRSIDQFASSGSARSRRQRCSRASRMNAPIVWPCSSLKIRCR